MSKYEVIWTTFRQVLQFLVISAIIWEFLCIFYFSPTKVGKLLFYSWKWANFFRKHAKLNYMKILKSPDPRPGPIFLNFTKTSRGFKEPPTNQNRVKGELTDFSIINVKLFKKCGRTENCTLKAFFVCPKSSSRTNL